MRFVCLFMLMASFAHGDWFRNPVAFKTTESGFELRDGINGFAVREELPISQKVAVQGTFTLKNSPPSKNWRVAALSVITNEKNFWHLGVVKTPADHKYEYSFELSEMLNEHWLSQNALKVEFSERTPGARIVPGSSWQMKLAMDAAGITGEIKDSSGKNVFRQRYLFTAKAVTCGRPAIHSTGLAGSFSEISCSAGPPVTVKDSPETFPPYQSENYVKQINSEPTGFFHVKQFPDGRWWPIDPLGRGVVVLGVDHTTFWGHYCAELGYHPHRKKNEKKYPDPSVWEEETLSRLKKWGFSMLGAGSQDSLNRRGLYHCVNLRMGGEFTACGEEFYITPHEGRPCSSFPNVFHPDFEMFCRYSARSKCAAYANDPWIFGWFIDNELAWWGRGKHETGLFDAAMKFDASHTAKQALIAFVKECSQNDISKFNSLWTTECKNFDELKTLTALNSITEEQVQVKHDFLKLVADRYFSISSKAIREVDPNHMVMGARFAGTGGADPVVWQISGKYCDVVSFNCYPKADLDENLVYSSFGSDAEPVADHFERFYNYVKKPMLITEWSFPALDAGLPSVHGAGQRFFTQTGRTAATKLFAQTMLSLPYLIGYDYFMWVDEPALGITPEFPEDSNYGLINEDGLPYKQLTDMFTALHADLYNQRTSPIPASKTGVARRSLSPAECAAQLKALNPDATPSVVKRNGDAYVVDNGRLRLEGKVGGHRFFDRVYLDNTLFGSYTAMAHTLDKNGKNLWREIQSVTSFKSTIENGCAVLEISGISRQEHSFEVTHRIALAPGADKFICELVEIKNSGDKPFPLKAAYFRLYGPGKDWGVSQSPRNLWGVPESGNWMHPANGLWYGAVASMKGTGIKIFFWKDKVVKSMHPDARFETDQTLTAGSTYKPDHPVYLVALCGTGGNDGWMKALKLSNTYLELAPAKPTQ